jgi:hypothetical protein
VRQRQEAPRPRPLELVLLQAGENDGREAVVIERPLDEKVLDAAIWTGEGEHEDGVSFGGGEHEVVDFRGDGGGEVAVGGGLGFGGMECLPKGGDDVKGVGDGEKGGHVEDLVEGLRKEEEGQREPLIIQSQ